MGAVSTSYSYTSASSSHTSHSVISVNMVSGPFLCFNEINFEDIPEYGTPEFKAFVEEVQKEGDALLEGTEDEKKNADWDVSKTQENGTVACKTRKARKNLDNGLKWHLRTGYFE